MHGAGGDRKRREFELENERDVEEEWRWSEEVNWVGITLRWHAFKG